MIVIVTRKDLNYTGQRKQIEDIELTDFADSRETFNRGTLVIILVGDMFRVLKSNYLGLDYSKVYSYPYLTGIMQQHIERIV